MGVASKSWKYKGFRHFRAVREATFPIHFTGRLPEHYHSFCRLILSQVVASKALSGGWLTFGGDFLVAFFGKTGPDPPPLTQNLPFGGVFSKTADFGTTPPPVWPCFVGVGGGLPQNRASKSAVRVPPLL